MKILELFAGSRSIGNVAEKLGHEVFSVDINNFKGVDLVMDIEFTEPCDIPFIPDIIWASPPCTTYSIAAISTHRDNQIAKTPFAMKSDNVIINLLRLIDKFKRRNKNLIYYIENPRGYLRKMYFMQKLHRTTITYCSYGDTRMKPTDIWSNNIWTMYNQKGWIPRPLCYNNNKKCHHEAAPRGSRTGTQGLENNYERSKIPEELCIEIIECIN